MEWSRDTALISALIGAAVSLTSGLVPVLMHVHEARDRRVKQVHALETAKKEIEVLASWLGAQERTACDPERLREIRHDASRELDAIWATLAESLRRFQAVHTPLAERGLLARMFLLYPPVRRSSWLLHVLYWTGWGALMFPLGVLVWGTYLTQQVPLEWYEFYTIPEYLLTLRAVWLGIGGLAVVHTVAVRRELAAEKCRPTGDVHLLGSAAASVTTNAWKPAREEAHADESSLWSDVDTRRVRRQFVVLAVLAVTLFTSGVWMTLAWISPEKYPYTAAAAVHGVSKLALLAVLLVVITTAYRGRSGQPVSTSQRTLIAVSIVLVFAAYVSGSLVHGAWPAWMLWAHRVSPWLAAAVTTAAVGLRYRDLRGETSTRERLSWSGLFGGETLKRRLARD